MSDLADAWADLDHANEPLGWTVSRPSFDNERNEWVLSAFDPQSFGDAQKRRERRVSVPLEFGEVGAVREMARALHQVSR